MVLLKGEDRGTVEQIKRDKKLQEKYKRKTELTQQRP